MFNFDFVQSILAVLTNIYSLNDKAAWKKFIQDLLDRVKPYAASTKTPLDDSAISVIEHILANDQIFDAVHFKVSKILSGNPTTLEPLMVQELVQVVNQQEAGKDTPEAINVAVVIDFVTKLLSIISTLKRTLN